MHEFRFYLGRESRWVGLVTVDIEHGGQLAFEHFDDRSIQSEIEQIGDEADPRRTFVRGRVLWLRRFEDGLLEHGFDIIAKRHKRP